MGAFAGVMQGTVLVGPLSIKTKSKDGTNFVLKWTPDESQFSSLGMKIPPPSDKPDVLQACLSQFKKNRVEVRAYKGSVNVLVIDHLESLLGTSTGGLLDVLVALRQVFRSCRCDCPAVCSESGRSPLNIAAKFPLGALRSGATVTVTRGRRRLSPSQISKATTPSRIGGWDMEV